VIPTVVSAPAEKRDIGARSAQGEILAFLDDDAYPRSDWLKNAVRHFHDPDVAAIGGPAITAPGDGVFAEASGIVYSSLLGGGSLRHRYRPVGSVREVQEMPSVNFFVRKDVFERVGGFNVHFWPGEDTKLCEDILKLGKKILYDPAVLVWHHRRSSLSLYLQQVYGYALHRGHFIKQYPRTSRQVIYTIPTLFLLGLVISPLLLPLHASMKVLYAVFISVYFAGIASSALTGMMRTKSIAAGLLSVPLIVLTHMTYGFAFPIGFVKQKLSR
jgi:GT2 family glycosyltransferase